MKPLFRLDVELTLLGPLLTRGQLGPPGIDFPAARDSQGRVMLPFSLIKGKVRNALRDLGHPRADDWLGKASYEGGFDPERGLLRFGDFATEQPGSDKDTIERIEINAETGSVRDRMLAFVEAPFTYGEPVLFTGRIEFCADNAEAEQIRQAVEQAMRWVPTYGAFRSTGFGRTKEVKAKLAACPPSSSGQPGGERLGYRLKLDRPFCVGGRKHARNHFDSLKHLPGAVLKGAVARLLLERLGRPGWEIGDSLPAPWGQFGKHFEKLRFSEARPAARGAPRPIEPPLTLVRGARQGSFTQCVALAISPFLIDGEAPRFPIDWKATGKIDEFAECRKSVEFGWPRVLTERRTRTAIDEDTGRAKDKQLFSYGLVRPGDLVWLGEIGLEAIPDSERADIRKRLGELLGFGLPGIGKTRASAEIEWTTPPATKALETRSSHVVTLQTEALLTHPDVVLEHGLEAAYRAYFHEASGGTLKLDRFFAQQELHGGFVANRSRKRGGGRYEPFLATRRGSAFVLSPTGNGDALACLRDWQATGLPDAAWLEGRYGRPLWQRCPLLRHVGCGEVAVDLDCHFSGSKDAQT